MTILQEKVGLSNEDLNKIRSMRLGRFVDLQLATASITKRVRTEFVGMDGTRCMIFRYPDESKWGSLGNGLFKDKSIIVRYILEDETAEIIAFKLKILFVATEPSHLIFTSFPLVIQSHDMRAVPRAKTRIAATLFDEQSDVPICDSLVLDISTHGCRMSIEKGVSGDKPKLRQIVKMLIAVSKDKIIYLTGTIMSSKYDQANLHYGVKFETPEDDVNKLLQNITLVTG